MPNSEYICNISLDPEVMIHISMSRPLKINFINLEFSFAGYHGSHGPIKVSDSTGAPELQDAFFEACEQLGIRRNDVNRAIQKGLLTYNDLNPVEQPSFSHKAMPTP